MAADKIKNSGFPLSLTRDGFFIPSDYILMKARFRREFMRLFTSELGKNAVVLDLNAGTDGLGPDFKKLGCSYSALESNPLIRNKLEEQSFPAEDWRAPWLPTRDNSVDFIVALAVIEHMPTWIDAMQLLLEARRALKPGGRMVIVAPNTPGTGATFYDDYKQCWFVSRKRLCDMADDARFEVLQHRYTVGWITLMGGPGGALLRIGARLLNTLLNLPAVRRMIEAVGLESFSAKVRKTIFELVAVEIRRPLS